MKTVFTCKVIITFFLLTLGLNLNAQIKYDNNGKLTIGNTTPYGVYGQTVEGSGMYFKCSSSNFFQIDVSPAATRLASHLDQVVFYNTQTNKFNSIQVKSVYNYSDARAKTNIQPLNNCLTKLMQLKTYSYKFKDENQVATRTFAKGGNANEYGLLAQEVETVLPELVITDPDGNKLINYIELVPMLLNAVQSLSREVETLKVNK